MSAVTEPAAAATPTPLEEPAPTIVSPESSGVGGSGQEGGAGDTSKSSPDLSPSTWKPNADAAEWKPSFGAPSAPVPRSPSPTAGEGGGRKAEAGEQQGKVGGGGAGEEDVEAEQPAAGGDAAVEASAGTVANGKGTAAEASSPPPAEATGATDASAAEEKQDGNAADAEGGGKRYEIEFLLKLRPKPEGTPRPAELTPPGRVDIMWDGKEPVAAKAGGSMRGGMRPLPPLGGRMGSLRGLGEARGAPPPLRGAQRDMGRDRDSRMDQRGSGSRDDRRSGGGGGGGGRDRGGGGGGGGRRVVIDTAPALEDCKPIEINEATRWKPKSLAMKDNAEAASKLSLEEVLMKANAILNKMTLEKFKKLSVSFMDVALRDHEVVTGVIDIIVEKAQAEPHFSSMYANLCECIARTPIPGLGEDPAGKDAIKGSKKFRKMLLIKVQHEFMKDWQGLFVAVQNDSELADDEKAEKEFGLKMKYTGHMRFVGELYKVELLREKHVQTAIHDMFGSADDPDEERLECMVKLLQTCGKKLDETGSPETAKDMKRLFKRIGKLADSRQVSSRIRFMLRDLIELRLNRWIPRREEEKAKTMEELHNDIAKEEESKNRASGRGGGSSARSSGIGSSSSLRPGSGDARVASGSRGGESSSSASRPTSQALPKTKDEDGWEVVPIKGAKGGGGGGERSQASTSRSRTSNPGSDERRGNANGGGGSGGSLVAQQSAFALLGSYDDDKDKKKKKKDSKSKKEKKEKSSGKDKEKKKSSKSSSSRPSPPSASGEPPAPARSSTPPAPPAVAAAAPATMTEEAARKKGKDTVAEFSVSGELGEACTCLSEIDPDLRWAAVSEAVTDAMERKQKHRDALGVVLAAGAKDGSLTAEALLKGLEDVLELVPDVCIDVPQAAKYVAAAAAPLVLGGHVAFSALVGSPCGGLLDGGKAAEFAVLAIGQVKEAAAASGLADEEAVARSKELTGGALDLAKLAAMLPKVCRGDEGKAAALLERHGVSL